MLLLHLSDLHLSRYGEAGNWSERKKEDGEVWKPIQSWQRWQIEGSTDRKGRPDKLRLVDPEGVVHRVKGWSGRKEDKLIGSLLTMAMKRHQTSTEVLVNQRPSAEDLAALLSVDPENTNLRFLRIVDDVLSLRPELIVITGDLTDKGFGYELVQHYLEPWVLSGHLFIVPGNHDSFDLMPRRGRMARTAANKDRYLEFAAGIGLEPNETGAYFRRVGDLAIVGLDSNKVPRTPLSAAGAVTKEQLAWLKELNQDPSFAKARLRIGLLHHHLLSIPFTVGKRSPFEVGMRLRNAVEVMEVCTEVKMDILFNGHRHHGYMVQLPSRPMVISSPSSTLGCKSTGRTYGWLMELDSTHPFPVIYPLNGIPQGVRGQDL